MKSSTQNSTSTRDFHLSNFHQPKSYRKVDMQEGFMQIMEKLDRVFTKYETENQVLRDRVKLAEENYKAALKAKAKIESL